MGYVSSLEGRTPFLAAEKKKNTTIYGRVQSLGKPLPMLSPSGHGCCMGPGVFWEKISEDYQWKGDSYIPSKIEGDLTNGPLSKLLELLDTQV